MDTLLQCVPEFQIKKVASFSIRTALLQFLIDFRNFYYLMSPPLRLLMTLIYNLLGSLSSYLNSAVDIAVVFFRNLRSPRSTQFYLLL